jgi:O-antigen/teichoic acid export membrane protein
MFFLILGDAPLIEIFKATFKTGVGATATLLCGAIGAKIIAVVLGPSGIGLFSLLKQAWETMQTLATVNGNAALVRGISRHKGPVRFSYLSTVFSIQLLSAGFTLTSLIAFAPLIAKIMLKQEDDITIALIRWLALPVLLGVLVSYLKGVLNGYRAIGRLALVGFSSSLVFALMAYPAAGFVKAGNPEAFIWLMVLSLSAGLAVAFCLSWRAGWIPQLVSSSAKRFQFDCMRQFLSIAATTLLTGFMTTGVMLLIRSMVVREMGWSGAGILDAAWMISMVYVTLILKSLGTYYLPTLSAITISESRVQFMQRFLRFAMLGTLPCVVGMIAIKPWIVQLLYSNEFIESLDILRWMLIGDFFKVTSWVLAFSMLAYADMRTYFWTEIIWNSMLFFGSYLTLTRGYAIEGIGKTFVIVYLTYLVFTICYTYHRYNFKPTKKIVIQWLSSFTLIALVSWFTWNETQCDWYTSVVWIITSIIFAIVALTSEERGQLILFLSGRSVTKK